MSNLDTFTSAGANSSLTFFGSCCLAGFFSAFGAAAAGAASLIGCSCCGCVCCVGAAC